MAGGTAALNQFVERRFDAPGLSDSVLGVVGMSDEVSRCCTLQGCHGFLPASHDLLKGIKHVSNRGIRSRKLSLLTGSQYLSRETVAHSYKLATIASRGNPQEVSTRRLWMCVSSGPLKRFHNLAGERVHGVSGEGAMVSPNKTQPRVTRSGPLAFGLTTIICVELLHAPDKDPCGTES